MRYIVGRFFSFVLVLFIFVGFGNAQDLVCKPEKSWFKNLVDLANIRQTATEWFYTTITDVPVKLTTGSTVSGIVGCTDYVRSKAAGTVSVQESSCQKTPDEVCASMNNQYETGSRDVNEQEGGFDWKRFRDGSSAGSLIGVNYAIANYTTYEPIPVNMAYYFKDYASRIPLVNNTAFAQESYEHQWILKPMLAIWKVMRNLAYGLIAAVMMYMGIAIITRKKLDQQTVVSVQYALPKVVIALIMITFSYPVGAVLSSFFYTLAQSSPSIVRSLFVGVGGTAIAAPLLGSIVPLAIVIIAAGASTFGAAVPIAVTTMIIALTVWVILEIVINFKTMIYILKMVSLIITAPLDFVIYALPGNDAKLAEWFKKMLSYGLSMLALKAIPTLVRLIGWSFINLESFKLGSILLSLILPWAIIIYGYAYAMGMPDKIDKAILGDSRKR